MEIIDGLSEALGTTFKTEDVQNNLTKMEETITQVETINNNSDKVTLEDKKYLRKELMEMIAASKTVKQFLENQLLRSAPARATEIEAIAMYTDGILKMVTELRKLNADICNIELSQKRLNQNLQIKAGTVNIQNNNSSYFLDSKTLDQMIENAEKNSKLKEIEVDFSTDEQIK